MEKSALDISDYLKLRSTQIEATLDRLITESDTPYNDVYRAARYSLLGTAKRLRPILALAVIETLGGYPEEALPIVCALELIHTYSLIHDDLPCMDDDDFRRGKPSLHKAFSESIAVLTGDFLLTHAFELIAASPTIDNEQKVQLIGSLSRNSGANGLIGGQVMDIQAEDKPLELMQIRLMHEKKTGALFAASAEFGGILVKASNTEMNLLRQYGKDLGLAFQVKDDVLDITQSHKKHGKEIGSDAAKNKTTFATLMGIKMSQAYVDTLQKTTMETLNHLPGDKTLLMELTSHILL